MKLRVVPVFVGFVVWWDRNFLILHSLLTDSCSGSNAITKHITNTVVILGHDKHQGHGQVGGRPKIE